MLMFFVILIANLGIKSIFMQSEEAFKAIQEQQGRIERGEDSSDHVPLDLPGDLSPDGLAQKTYDESREDELEAEERRWELYEKFIRGHGISEEEFSTDELYRYFESESGVDTDRPVFIKVKKLTTEFDKEDQN